MTPQTVAEASLSVGLPRQEYCSGLPFPPLGDLLHPGMEPSSPALAVHFFTAEPPGKPKWILQTERNRPCECNQAKCGHSPEWPIPGTAPQHNPSFPTKTSLPLATAGLEPQSTVPAPIHLLGTLLLFLQDTKSPHWLSTLTFWLTQEKVKGLSGYGSLSCLLD